MKMGRVMMVLCLLVVGVGCTRDPGNKSAGAAIAGAEWGKCPIDTVEVSASDGKEDPKLDVEQGQVIYIYGRPGKLRGQIPVAATGKQVVPLKSVRIRDETLWYGAAPKNCWGMGTSGGPEIACVKCLTDIKNDPQLNEPCCYVNLN